MHRSICDSRPKIFTTVTVVTADRQRFTRYGVIESWCAPYCLRWSRVRATSDCTTPTAPQN